jgi:hypothetical protein
VCFGIGIIFHNVTIQDFNAQQIKRKDAKAQRRRNYKVAYLFASLRLIFFPLFYSGNP